MVFENIFFPNEFELPENLNPHQEFFEADEPEMELDFIESYRDLEGILHVRTCFDHSDMEHELLWEIFEAKDSLCPLELLLPNYG